MAGAAPFAYGSDEKIANEVIAGLRPERPSNNPSHGTLDELWEQIVACWSQESKDRPTAFEVMQTLQALGEAQHQEPAVSMEDFGDETIMGEWDWVGGILEESMLSSLL